MANYNVVIGSKFKPYSYEEYVKPLIDQTEAHIALENQYADLATKAGVWEGMLNPELDGDTYSKYTQYSQDLDLQAEQLAKQGLSINSRQAIANMKKRYSNDIVPIEQAYNKREALSAEQRKLELEGYKFERDIASTALSTFINNPTYDYGKSYNIKELQNQVTSDYKALSKAARSNPNEFYRMLEAPGYLQSIKQTGYTKEEIQEALQNGNEGPLMNVLTNAIRASGIANWEGSYTEDGQLTELGAQRESELRSSLSNKMWNALGDTTTKELSDKQWDNKQKEAMAIRAEQRALNRARQAALDKEHAEAPRLGAKVVLGTSGSKYTKETDSRLLGLSSAGTNKTIELSTKLEGYRQQLSEYSEDDIRRFENHKNASRVPVQYSNNSYAQLGASMNASNSTPSGYGKYKQLQQDILNTEKALNEEMEYVKGVYNKYAHLGVDPTTAITRGEDLTAKQSNKSVVQLPVLTNTDAKYNNLTSNLNRIIQNNLPSSKDSDVGLYKEEGDKVKKVTNNADINDILNGDIPYSLNVQYGGKSGTGIKVVTSEGTYDVRGIKQLDSFNNNLQKLEQGLTDFSLETITNKASRNDISPQKLTQLYEQGLGVLTEDDIKNTVKIPNTNLKVAVLYDTVGSDHIKIVLDSNNKILGYNSVGMEMENPELSSRFIEQYATRGISDLTNILTGN